MFKMNIVDKYLQKEGEINNGWKNINSKLKKVFIISGGFFIFSLIIASISYKLFASFDSSSVMNFFFLNSIFAFLLITFVIAVIGICIEGNKSRKIKNLSIQLFEDLQEGKIKELTPYIIDEESKKIFLELVKNLAQSENKEKTLKLFKELIEYKKNDENIQIENFLSKHDISFNQPKNKLMEML